MTPPREQKTIRRKGKSFRPRTTDERSEKRGERGARLKGKRSDKTGSARSERPHRSKKSSKGPWKKTAYSVTTKRESSTSQTIVVGGEERLQKIIANAGLCSRREAERLILEGAVTLNGRTVTELGTKADPKRDKIKVNGKLIFTDVERIYIVFYKPKAVIAALKDPEGRPCIADYLRSVQERVVPVGQMDFNSEGLMLLSNDGDMVNKIIKTRNLPKIYMVKVKGHPEPEILSVLKDGIFSAEGVVRFADLQVEQELRNKSWLKLEVTEGARLDLRELLNRRGLLVDRIVRTAVGHLSVQNMQPGELKFVKKSDFQNLTQY